MASKFCNKCQLTKPVYDFTKRTNSPDGYEYRCDACNVEHEKQWRINNPDQAKERSRNYYVNNIQVRISKSMHNKLRNLLKRGSHTHRTEEIIGLNQVTHLEWLSFNFENEMTWTNYGKVWQIDLIIPASSFDLTVKAQLLACFNWKNIRPCMKSDNLAKYNFILPFAQANQPIRVLAFIRKLRQIKLEAFLDKFE